MVFIHSFLLIKIIDFTENTHMCLRKQRHVFGMMIIKLNFDK